MRIKTAGKRILRLGLHRANGGVTDTEVYPFGLNVFVTRAPQVRVVLGEDRGCEQPAFEYNYADRRYELVFDDKTEGTIRLLDDTGYGVPKRKPVTFYDLKNENAVCRGADGFWRLPLSFETQGKIILDEKHYLLFQFIALSEKTICA